MHFAVFVNGELDVIQRHCAERQELSDKLEIDR